MGEDLIDSISERFFQARAETRYDLSGGIGTEARRVDWTKTVGQSKEGAAGEEVSGPCSIDGFDLHAGYHMALAMGVYQCPVSATGYESHFDL